MVKYFKSDKLEIKKLVVIVSFMVTVFVSFTACNLLPSKENTMRITNRLQHEILLIESSNIYDERVIRNTFPITIESGKSIVLHSNDWFSSTEIVFTYDGSRYVLEIPYVHNKSNVKAYFIESDETEFGFRAYVQYTTPSPIRITLSNEGGETP